MNSFDQEMAQKAGVITMWSLEINALTTEFRVDVNYVSSVKQLEIRIHNNTQRSISKQVGRHRVFYILSLDSVLTKKHQMDPHYMDCTIDQMTHVLFQIKQALSEDHSREKAA